MSHTITRANLILLATAALLALSEPATSRAERSFHPAPARATQDATPNGSSLAPTLHPPIARDVATLWIVPSEADRSAITNNPALGHLQAALKLYAQEKYDLALARFMSAATPQSPLRSYATYYAGVSELRLKRFEAARRRFSGLKDAEGFLSEAVALGEAEAAQELGEHGAAAKIYDRLLQNKPVTSRRFSSAWRLRRRPTTIRSGQPRRTCACITNIHSASTQPRPRARSSR